MVPAVSAWIVPESCVSVHLDSFTGCDTLDPRFSRITVVVHGDEQVLEQIEKQVAKLVDIRDIRELKPEESVYRELILVKVKADATQRPGIIAVVDSFRAKIVDFASESLVIELTGNQQKLEAFIGLMNDYGILELARTGIAGLGRGCDHIINIE